MHFGKLCHTVFRTRKRNPLKEGYFYATNFENAIKEIIKMYGEAKNQDEKMLDIRPNACKT